MKLLLDLGNSRLKWALAAQAHWTQGALEAPEGRLGPALLEVLPGGAEIDAIWLSSVRGGAAAELLSESLRAALGLPVRHARSESARGCLRNAYLEPSQLGVDRWLAMLGAWRPGQPLLVVDAGTGLTLDAVDADGKHLGGLILPGPTLLAETLPQRARQLPPARLDPATAAACPWARDTASALGHAALLACAALIERMLDRLRASHPARRLVLTGGAADLLIPLLAGPLEHEPDLVLRGLARYAQV